MKKTKHTTTVFQKTFHPVVYTGFLASSPFKVMVHPKKFTNLPLTTISVEALVTFCNPHNCTEFYSGKNSTQ